MKYFFYDKNRGIMFTPVTSNTPISSLNRLKDLHFDSFWVWRNHMISESRSGQSIEKRHISKPLNFRPRIGPLYYIPPGISSVKYMDLSHLKSSSSHRHPSLDQTLIPYLVLLYRTKGSLILHSVPHILLIRLSLV